MTQLILDSSQQKAVKFEVEIWKKLGKHPNIVKFISAQSVKNSDGSQDMLILNELCDGGTLFDHIKNSKSLMKEPQILSIIKDIVAGVKQMHSIGIAHRDLKVENVLYHQSKFKLCDFGSASSEVLDYNQTSKLQISKAMEIFEKHTTLMYRPPEMMDQYLGYTVDLKADIWMLGCILYSLCFQRHPFQDSQKLAIINAHYYMVNEEQFDHISEKMRDLIRLMLTPNPTKRPSIQAIELMVENFDQIKQIELSDDAMEIKNNQEKHRQVYDKRNNKISKQPAAPQNQSNQQWSAFDNQAASMGENHDNTQGWDVSWHQQPDQPNNNQSNNPFDQYIESYQQKPKDDEHPQTHNPFDFYCSEQQDQVDQINEVKDPNSGGGDWFFAFDKDDKNEDEKKENDWMQWDQNHKKPGSDEDDDEEQPNMFQQINEWKSNQANFKDKLQREEEEENAQGIKLGDGVTISSSQINKPTKGPGRIFAQQHRN